MPEMSPSEAAPPGASPSGGLGAHGGVAVPASEEPIRVVLAEGHRLLRASLRGLLEAEPDIEVVAAPERLDQVAASVAESRPDVLVLDLSMSGGAAADLLRASGGGHGDMPIVALSMENSRAFARGAVAAGASAHVVQEHANGELPAAVRAVLGRAALAGRARAHV